MNASSPVYSLPMHRRWLFPLFASLLLSAASVAQVIEPGTKSNYPPPEKCQVVVEDMGRVGLRIADAQAFAERTVTGLRKRLSVESVIYEGLLKSAKDMKRRLGGSDTSLQDEQIAYFKAAAKAAKWRVKVKFGRKKGKHWVKATCWRSHKGKRKGKPVETRTWRDKRLDKLKATYGKEIATFCLEIDPPKPKPEEQAAPISRPKKKKEWSLPPMRR